MGGYVIKSSELPFNSYTGQAQYADGAYTEASPFSITADTKVTLPNSGVKFAPQMPSDIVDFYDSSTQKILGRDGDGVLIGIEFLAKPTSVQATLLKVTIDIGLPEEIFPQSFPLDKGAGVEHAIYHPVLAYNASNWETNGGLVKVECNGPASLYGIRYVFHRSHKAR